MSESNKACAHKDWPGAEDASQTILGKKFAALCPLKTLPGLDFGAGLTAYRCDTNIPNAGVDKDQKKRKTQLIDLLGKAEFERLRKHDGTKDAFLNGNGTLDGMAVSLVLLADAQGELKQTLASEAELDKALKGVTAKEGAAALVYLRNILENIPTNDLFCKAEFKEEKDGWLISNIVRRPRLDHKNPLNVTLHVSKSGKVTGR